MALAVLLAMAAFMSQGADGLESTAPVAVAAAARRISKYKRGKGLYSWVLTARERERGIGYYGSAERLRAKVKDMQDGERAA